MKIMIKNKRILNNYLQTKNINYEYYIKRKT